MKRNLTSVVFWSAAAIALGAMLTGLGCPCPCLGPAGFGTDPSLALIQEASRRAKEQDPNAIVFQVEGLYGSTVPGPSLTLEYTFVATDPDSPVVTWQLDYDRTNWTVKQINSPFVGVGFYDLTQVTMSFEQARTLLLAAGHENNFHGWSLHQPLFGDPDPVYTFTYGDKTVLIDTVTQAITVINHDTSGPVAAVPGEDSVSIAMILAATAEIKKTNANAFIIWAGGRDASGNPLNAPGETNVWDFYAVDNGVEVKSWSLQYDGQWTVTELAVPPFEIEFWDISQITMDVVEAWANAVAAGYGPPYNWWCVFKPLNPTIPNPGFILRDSAGRLVVVDTVTGEVSVEQGYRI